jgi:hypothetical protein
MSDSTKNTASRWKAFRWKIVNIVITVTKNARFSAKDGWDWKKSFKELKLSAVRAENTWTMVLNVDEKEAKSIYSLCDGRFRVETVMEEETVETWEDKSKDFDPTVAGAD